MTRCKHLIHAGLAGPCPKCGIEAPVLVVVLGLVENPPEVVVQSWYCSHCGPPEGFECPHCAEAAEADNKEEPCTE